MKKIILLLGTLVLAGCATHADIKMPVVTQVHNSAYENKSMSYDILYSQPKPGIFSGGEQLPLKPLNEAELSVASVATLQKLPDYIFKQLPSTVKRIDSGNADYKLKVELVAHDKHGPTYADYEAAKSFGKNLITMGLASAEYNIVADFDAKYVLYKQGEEFFSKEYKVKDQIDHERGDLESFNTLNDYAGQMLEKHLILTLNNFFSEAVE